MVKQNLSRRGFLKAGGLTAVSALALTLTGITVSPNAWSITLTQLDAHTGRTLSHFCRVLYPHNSLENLYYDACVEQLDSQVSTDKTLLQLLTVGVQGLDAIYDSPFSELPADKQLAAVKQIEGSAFFNKVRAHMVVALYNNENIWDGFGYQGPSFPYGGYLDRGFNDIDWLPES